MPCVNMPSTVSSESTLAPLVSLIGEGSLQKSPGYGSAVCLIRSGIPRISTRNRMRLPLTTLDGSASG